MIKGGATPFILFLCENTFLLAAGNTDLATVDNTEKIRLRRFSADLTDFRRNDPGRWWNEQRDLLDFEKGFRISLDNPSNPLLLELSEALHLVRSRFLITHLFNKGKVPWIGLDGISSETDPKGSFLFSIGERKSVFTVVLKDEVPFPEGTSCHNLDGVAATGIRLHDGDPFFIRGLPDAQTIHQNLGSPETDGYAGTDVTMKIDALLEPIICHSLFSVATEFFLHLPLSTFHVPGQYLSYGVRSKNFHDPDLAVGRQRVFADNESVGIKQSRLDRAASEYLQGRGIIPVMHRYSDLRF